MRAGLIGALLIVAIPEMAGSSDARAGEASSADGQSASVASVTLSPSTIAGGSGDSATGTVTLSAPAPAGGAVVALTSSNVALAATLPRITVREGETSATFAVGTNARYRQYSELSFTVTISATLGVTRGAPLTITAQPKPPDFTSGSQAGSNTQWDGLMCGGIAPIGGQPGILYDCSPAGGTGFGSCTFRQECSVGCQRVPPSGGTFNDFCVSSGPNPVALASTVVVGGDRVPAQVVAPIAAGQGADLEVGSLSVIDPFFNATDFPNTGITFERGDTSVSFEVGTSYVPAIQFVDVTGFWFNDSIPPLLITNGRAGQAWLTMLPPDSPPAVALPTLGDFFIAGLNPITGGESTFGAVHLSGLSRAGGPRLTLTSSHPQIVPSQTIDTPASQTVLGFQAPFGTNPTSVDTDVTVTLSDGRYSFSDVLTVRASPPPPVFADLVVTPGTVVGGSPATGTVVLSAPQSTPTVVQISIIQTAPATLPASHTPCPDFSRCDNVTVPAGATSASFVISTSPVTSQFNLNVFGSHSGSPGQQALLLITPGGPLTVQSLGISPVDLVGGASATGTVSLSGPAPSGGAVVALSKSLSNGGAGTVPVTIPASVTVPAGQTSASFAIATSPVSAATNVRLSATFNGATVNADLTLFALLQQIAFSGNVPGGTPATGTVRLGAPAPGGGTVVALASANTSLVTVPASVTVPAGQTTVDFTATTAPVTQTTGVGVSAALGGTTVSTTVFLVVSRAVSSVTLNPNTVVGPASSTATVTLRSAAPSGNAVVSLASSNAVLATVPFSVVVPAGQTSTTFTVNAAQVTATSTVVISATYENVTQSATLTINPSGGSGGGGSPDPGFASPASHAPDSGGDGNGFQSSALNALADDGVVATDTNSGSGTSTSCTSSSKDRHRFYDFGLSVPAGSTVTGLEVRLDARADSTSGSPRMCVQLSWDGGANWTAAKATSTLGTSLTTFVLGGASDAWGRGWSAANLSNPGFRVRIVNVASSTSRDFFLDWVAVRVHTGASAPTEPAATGTLTVAATGRSGQTVFSSPAGISVSVGSTQSASFAVGTSITLSVSNGRDAVWSGACSSGGNRRRTCTFTLQGSASVTANVR
jgi:hypothetical protein